MTELANMTGGNVFKRRLTIIAGPCSAETEAQVMRAAREVAALGRAHYFRAGVWKPRTRPGAFEGNGAPALTWLKRARETTGLPLAVEAATPEHAEACLNADVDAIWIGARTTVNPFMTSELAEALRGADVPVLVKNPVNPDLNLWIGALERFSAAGARSLAAVHRGFSVYRSGEYRNPPFWQIPIELKRLAPELPLFCDPSHICGQTDTLAAVAQKALDLQYNGLMIETHPEPANAWSDARQQITPQALNKLLDGLSLRETGPGDPVTRARISAWRDQIDDVDAEIIEALARRMNVIREVAFQKRAGNLAILQPERWNQILERCRQAGKTGALSESFLKDVFSVIHEAAIALQDELMNAEFSPRTDDAAHG